MRINHDKIKRSIRIVRTIFAIVIAFSLILCGCGSDSGKDSDTSSGKSNNLSKKEVAGVYDFLGTELLLKLSSDGSLYVCDGIHPEKILEGEWKYNTSEHILDVKFTTVLPNQYFPTNVFEGQEHQYKNYGNSFVRINSETNSPYYYDELSITPEKTLDCMAHDADVDFVFGPDGSVTVQAGDLNLGSGAYIVDGDNVYAFYTDDDNNTNSLTFRMYGENHLIPTSYLLTKYADENILDDESNFNSISTSNSESSDIVDNSAPDHEVVLADLKSEFLSYTDSKFKFALTLLDFEVERSQTSDKEYTASIKVFAKSKYADFEWQADIEYTKYDQGWILDNCDWGEHTYEVLRYPEGAKLHELIYEATRFKMLPIDMSYEGEKFYYRAKTAADWCEYARGESVSVVAWRYNDYYGNWEYLNTTTEEGSFEITDSLEQKWFLYQEDGYVDISNVTSTGFDVEIKATYYEVDSAHFNLESGTISWTDDGRLSLKFQCSNMYFKDYRNNSCRGDATITLIFPKTTTEVYNIWCDDCFFDVMILTKSGSGIGAFSSYVVE